MDLLELNISCPNVEEGELSFGTDPHVVERVVKAVRHYAKQPLIVKLSPEVTDITEIAKATVSGGADALSLINTLRGMKIDIRNRKAILANRIGGYSGPGIMPIAVRMVYEVCKAVDIHLREQNCGKKDYGTLFPAHRACVMHSSPRRRRHRRARKKLRSRKSRLGRTGK